MCEVNLEPSEDDFEHVFLRRIFLGSDSRSEIYNILSPNGMTEATVSGIINYIRENVPTRYQTYQLDELQKTLEANSPNGFVKWSQFKEASRFWIDSIVKIRFQDSNNNFHDESLDGLTEQNSDDERDSRENDDDVEDSGISDKKTPDLSTEDHQPRRYVTTTFVNLSNGSNYSTGSNETTENIESMIDLQEEPDIVTENEFRVRMRRYEEENVTLREELLRADELITNLQRQLETSKRRLEQATEKCRLLEKENDERVELLSETEAKEKSCRATLQKLEKDRDALLKNIKTLESELHAKIQTISNLNVKLQRVSKEKAEYVKRAVEIQEEFNERQTEYEFLRARIKQLEELQESSESTIRHLRCKNQELTTQNAELHSRSCNSQLGDGLSLTPPTNYFGNSNLHSTPYRSHDSEPQVSLYNELKATGFSIDGSDAKNRDLEEELCFYNDEIHDALEELESILQRFFAAFLDKPFAPISTTDDAKDCHNHDMKNLKERIKQLSEMTKQVTSEKKDAVDVSTQVAAESEDRKRLDELHIQKFEDWSRSTKVPLNRKETESQEEGDPSIRDPFVLYALDAKDSATTVEERVILDPIVHALDGLLQGVLLQDSSSSPAKSKSALTLPPRKSPSEEEQEDKAHGKTFVISSRGDGPSELTEPLDIGSAESARCAENSRFRETLEQLQLSSPLHLKSMSNQAGDFGNSTQMSAAYCETPFQIPSVVPRRKISVFQRSFDVSALTVAEEDRPVASSETFVVRRSTSSPTMQNERVHGDEVVHEVLPPTPRTYFKMTAYRNVQNETDSSTDSPSPTKRPGLFEENFTPIVNPVRPKVVLAPTKFKLPESRVFVSPKSDIDGNPGDKEATNSSEDENPARKDVPKGVKLTEETNGEEKSDANFLGQQRVTSKESESPSSNVNCRRQWDLSSFSLMDSPINGSKEKMDISFSTEVDEKDPPILAGITSPLSTSEIIGDDVTGNSVALAMSSGEDSSDSGCDPLVKCEINEKQISASSTIIESTPGPSMAKSATVLSAPNHENAKAPSATLPQHSTKRDNRQRFLAMRRSLSESENGSPTQNECRCRDPPNPSPEGSNGKKEAELEEEAEERPKAFPSLTDGRLQESGIANLSDTESEFSNSLSEEDFEGKYTAFSIGLNTDRVTLSRRLTLAMRQRDQSERNLEYEVQKMHQDIQELAPLCIDRESLERVERVRHQLEMIAKCAHRVSSVAETLGAVHQENRISRAVYLADRYLQVLKSRCEKLAADVSETKRILSENNIVIEEINGELGDDLPRIRYRSGVPSNNRTMMARRRASIATMSRPLGSGQDVVKEPRQRNSVSGRMTLRRPSFSYETQKWDTEKLDRTDSSSSIAELREIFEQAESRRNSREENNNVSRNSIVNVNNCDIIDEEIWYNTRDNGVPELLAIEHRTAQESRQREFIPLYERIRNIQSWHQKLFYVALLFFVYYLGRISSSICTDPPYKWWSFEEILERYIQVRNVAPRPM